MVLQVVRFTLFVGYSFLARLILSSNFVGEGREYWGEENISEEMPACQQMFNIFHPFDPVAYR